MLRSSRIGAVILLAFLLSQIPAIAQSSPATTDSTAYRFEGRLVYRTADGSLLPLVPDLVLVGWGEGRCQFTIQSPENLQVDADGTFRLLLEQSSSGIERVSVRNPDGSWQPPTCVEAVTWPCYRFRANGCEDRILQFGPKPPDAVVEVSCPGRSGAIPKRDG